MYFLRPLICFFFITGFFSSHLFAQCISQLPYTENFETSDGGWTTGGNASDWAWGTPNKPAISRAGNGAKCWVAGSLTGNHYNDNEASWLQSPCFDFTRITSPYFSFQINWDTEKGYDGAGVQYSTDNGITWQSAGNYGDAATGCSPSNWYTDAHIRYALQDAGWSGSSLTIGRDFGGWVKAYHSFPELAGKSNVKFRFIFGAGNIKNDFGGVGIDDIYVGETPADNQLSFTYTCSQNVREAVVFTYYSDCIDLTSLQWNFDDPASGAQNTPGGILAESFVHPFSEGGMYHVILTAKDNKGNTVNAEQTIVVPDVQADIKTPVSCPGGKGILEATVTNTDAPVYYTWQTDPAINTRTAEVKAGTYSVMASVTGGCLNNVDITLPDAIALHHDVQTTPADCNNLNGSATLTESGGLAPYQYAWPDNLSASSFVENLLPGVYYVVVTDKNLCTDTAMVQVAKQPSTLTYTTEATLPDCGEQNGSLQINVSGGNPSYTYEWTPAISTSGNADNISSGTYTVVITDNSQCRDTVVVILVDKPLRLSLGSDTTICKGQSVFLQAAGSYASYLWNDGTTLPVKEADKEGNYVLTVTNSGGCRASDTVHVFTGCGDLVFPSGFTPNGDGLNDDWGASGGLSQVSDYHLLVYNRYGNRVFESANPFQRWRGDKQRIRSNETYVFMVSYVYKGERKGKKGTVVLLL